MSEHKHVFEGTKSVYVGLWNEHFIVWQYCDIEDCYRAKVSLTDAELV